MLSKIRRFSFFLVALIFIPFAVNHASAAEVGVSFDPSPDDRVIGYNLYYGFSEDFDQVIDLGTQTQYYFNDLQANSIYYFAATAYDAYGNESDFSNIVAYETPSDDPDPQSDPLLEFGEISVDHNWKQVNFEQDFIDPVVIAKPCSLQDLDPATIRIRNINNTSFEIRIQEWEYLDGNHDYEKVSYFVIEKGSYILPGNIMIEAGTFVATAPDFQSVSFDSSFQHVPVLVASVISENKTEAVTGRIRNIDPYGFDFCLQEQETTIYDHCDETIAYIAWEPSSGSLNALSFEVETTGNIINSQFKYIPYKQDHLIIPSLIADMQTTNGGDTANLRWQNKDIDGFCVQVGEEASLDGEVGHVNENIGYILLSEFNENNDSDGDGLLDIEEIDIYFTNPNTKDSDNDGIDDGKELNLWGVDWSEDIDSDGLSNIMDPDSDGDGFMDGYEILRGFDPGDAASVPNFLIEIGEAIINHNWQRVSFTTTFYDPVVVANPLSLNGADPATVRIRNLDSTGFEIRLQEWEYLDVGHLLEQVGYLVMERGDFRLPDGTRVSAGSFEKGGCSFSSVFFNQPFGIAPIIVVGVTTFNESVAVTGRIQKINKNGFEYMLQEQELNFQDHGMETISYIAWEPSSGTFNGINYEINAINNLVTHNTYVKDFSNPFMSTPILLADMQTTNGGDTANLRLTNKDSYSFGILVDEEQSKDDEISHITESIGYMAFLKNNN